MQPGIDNWGHLGGLIGGALFAWFAGPLMRVQTTYYGYELADTQPKQGFVVGDLTFCGVIHRGGDRQVHRSDVNLKN